MKFRTGFVLGAAAGLYATRKVRQLRGPLAGGATLVAPAEWPSRTPGSTISSEKVRALGDLARERATDVLRGPMGDLARERVVAVFEGVLASQREQLARRR